MKKGALIFSLFMSLAFVSAVSAFTITEIVIESQDHSEVLYEEGSAGAIYRWDTVPDALTAPYTFSPIGVSASLGGILLNSADTTVNFNINPGESVYLFTEAFQAAAVFNNLFGSESYQLRIIADGNVSTLNFSFGENGVFILGESSGPFTLSFLGFTANRVDSNASLVPGSSGQDAVYQLQAQAVPEPATLLLFGFGLVGLTAFGRKRLIG